MMPVTVPLSTREKTVSFLATWGPRAIAVAVGGYYGLGLAYEWGLLALIDRAAIPLIKHVGGYAAVGAAMPTFQWYSAWAVRFAFGLLSACLYDLTVRATQSAFAHFSPPKPAPASVQ